VEFSVIQLLGVGIVKEEAKLLLGFSETLEAFLN
jgi:hypothetical protein